MKFLVEFLAFCLVLGAGNAAPAFERPQTVQARTTNDLSLKLLPPKDINERHHYHHHHGASDAATTTRPPPAATTKKPQGAEIINYQHDYLPGGGYHFAYTLSDGTMRDETGGFVNNAEGIPIWTVRGFFSYYTPDGQLHYARFIADDNGYQQEDMPPNQTPPPPAAAPIPPAEISGSLIATLAGRK